MRSGKLTKPPARAPAWSGLLPPMLFGPGGHFERRAGELDRRFVTLAGLIEALPRDRPAFEEPVHVFGFHHLCDLGQRRLRRHGTRSLRHDICNFGAHLAPFAVASVVSASPRSKPARDGV